MNNKPSNAPKSGQQGWQKTTPKAASPAPAPSAGRGTPSNPAVNTSTPATTSLDEIWETYKENIQEENVPRVTREDINERMWQREQAERMGLDPDTFAGPVLFTDDEWEMMTSTREARIAFGYELPCGCRPGSCSSEYGGDCNNYDYDTDELEIWHESICEDPKSVFYTDSRGRKWAIREFPDAGMSEYANTENPLQAYSGKGTIEETVSLIEADASM